MLIKLLLMLKELIRCREPFLCALVCFQLLNWSWALWPQQVTVISGSHLGLFASVNVVAFQLQMVKYFIFRGGSPFQQLNGLMLHLFTYIFFTFQCPLLLVLGFSSVFSCCWYSQASSHPCLLCKLHLCLFHSLLLHTQPKRSLLLVIVITSRIIAHK